jgi:hypothetical protein
MQSWNYFPVQAIRGRYGRLSYNVLFWYLDSLGSYCGKPVLPQEARVSFVNKNVLLIQCKEKYVTVAAGLQLCAGGIWRSVRVLSCVGKRWRDGMKYIGHY